MISKKCLESLIESLGSRASIRETIDQLDISGHLTPERSNQFQLALNDFSENMPDGWSISVRDGEFSEISIASVADDDVNLAIRKPSGGRIFFASVAGFSSALEHQALTLSKEILVLSPFTGFKTRGFSVISWGGEPLPGLPCAEPNADAIDPRKTIVRDLTGSIVPADPYRWMLVGADGSGEPWQIWKARATRSLATLLVSEVWREDTPRVSLNGARKRTFPLGEGCSDVGAYTNIFQAVDWLLVKQDAEARHEVLVRRLAVIVRDLDTKGEPDWLTALSESLQEALDGARLDHRAYVRSKSAETVKAMADLRKTVGEDVSRIVERVHRLSTGFVVGLAALATGLGVRLTLLTSQKNLQPLVGVMFCLVVLGITWSSILLQRHVSSKSLLNELRNMRRWRKNVHTALTRSDYREMASYPVLDAVRLYKKTARFTHKGLIIGSIVFLISFVMPLFYTDDLLANKNSAPSLDNAIQKRDPTAEAAEAQEKANLDHAPEKGGSPAETMEEGRTKANLNPAQKLADPPAEKAKRPEVKANIEKSK